MKDASLDDFIADDDFLCKCRSCLGCGLGLEPGEADFCYLCSPSHLLSRSTELKGGIEKIAQSEPKGDKPDFKGNLEVVAWSNVDRYGNKFITVQFGNRVNLFRNDQKQED